MDSWEVKWMYLHSRRHRLNLLLCHHFKKILFQTSKESHPHDQIYIFYLRACCSVFQWQWHSLAFAPRVGFFILSRTKDHLHWPATGGQDFCDSFSMVATAARWAAAHTCFPWELLHLPTCVHTLYSVFLDVLSISRQFDLTSESQRCAYCCVMSLL